MSLIEAINKKSFALIFVLLFSILIAGCSGQADEAYDYGQKSSSDDEYTDDQYSDSYSYDWIKTAEYDLSAYSDPFYAGLNYGNQGTIDVFCLPGESFEVQFCSESPFSVAGFEEHEWDKAITMITPNALCSSNNVYEESFSYTTEIEQIFTFYIPSGSSLVHAEMYRYQLGDTNNIDHDAAFIDHIERKTAAIDAQIEYLESAPTISPPDYGY